MSKLVMPQSIKSNVIAASLILIFLLTAWQVTSNMLNEKGLNESNEGQIEQGLQDYELANHLYPFSAPNRKLASENYFRLYQTSQDPQDLNLAIQCAETAVKLVPFSGLDHHFLAGLYVSANDLQQAETHYKAAIRYNAYDLLSFMDFAAFYLRQSDQEKALEVLLDGSRRINRAIGSFETPEERLAAYQQGIVIDSVLANLYTKRGDSEQATVYRNSAENLKVRYDEFSLDYIKEQEQTQVES